MLKSKSVNLKKEYICRTCGKTGWKPKKIKIKLSSGILNTYSWNNTCTFCKSLPIDDDDWQDLLDNNLVKDGKATKEGLNHLRIKANKIKKKNKQGSKINNKNKSNTIFKGINLIPDSIFGIGIYVLIILFCIWAFGDYGAECGVDYAPRFFGEC